MTDLSADQPSPSHAGLIVRDVAHAYRRKTPVLRGVSLSVPPGTIHCLLGPSGCGKTTLLRLIAGLETRQQGKITIAGKAVAGDSGQEPPERRSVGFVFQDYALFPHLNARQNVMFGMSRGNGLANRLLGLLGKGRSTRHTTADKWLNKVGLAGFERAMPHTLSGGQQQRVAIARALAHQPAVMLLDEPFSGLDSELREQVREIALRVLRDAGIATVMVTHDPREAAIVGDAVSVMRDGLIERTATPGELQSVG